MLAYDVIVVTLPFMCAGNGEHYNLCNNNNCNCNLQAWWINTILFFSYEQWKILIEKYYLYNVRLVKVSNAQF